VMFSLGAAALDNYIANVFFWLLSGVAFAAIGSPARSDYVRSIDEPE
jgi:hypothetical protein